MNTIKIQFFTLCILISIISLSSCSGRYVGSFSSSDITLAKAEQKHEAVTLIKTVEINEIATDQSSATEPITLLQANTEANNAGTQEHKPIAKKLKKLKGEMTEKAIAMASPLKKVHKKANNINLKVWGIIMAVSGVAAALIVGIWLTPALGTLGFLWMVLAIAFAFWGIFLAFLGEAYSWENKPRE